MIIESITLKNFKSFGNNKQTVKFDTDTGKLILISGSNGNGKTSFQQSIDYSLFGTVRGKNSKKVARALLPNRTNKNLETEIVFTNNFSDKIRIERCLSPNKDTIFINDNNKTKHYKNLTQENKDKILGFDFETYKNFVSMSVSDFANFIDLTPIEKRKIINKLFNLQDLDNYLSLSNSLIKNLSEEKEKYQRIFNNNIETIKTLRNNIEKIKNSNVIDKDKEIKKLNIEKESKREPYLTLKKKVSDIEQEIVNMEKNKQDMENKRSVINNEIIEIKIELKSINEKIMVYKSGTCPVCDSNLKVGHKHNLEDILKVYGELNTKYRELNDKKDKLTLEITKIYNQKQSSHNKKNTTRNEYNNVVYDLKNIAKEISKIKHTKEETPIGDLEKNANDLEITNIENNKKIKTIEDKIKIYSDLKEVFSTSGVRKSIIKNIVKPINVYLKEILDDLKSIYTIKIDEEFNVKIFERLTLEIHPESLSMGESKKINIAIALSYLKLILKLRNLNIIFLDEVFSSMEPDNVEYTLLILKKFTKEFNLNILILDPKVYFKEENDFGAEHFDRIIKITKEINFSTITE